MEEKNVLIGDYIGTIEEFVPGEGTYSEDGKIYAASIGKVVVDREKHVASVEGKTLAQIKVGHMVFGEVFRISNNAVVVSISKIKGIKGIVDIKAGIYVSNIADSYVERPEDMFGIGDIVKAKVIKIEQGLVDLSTRGDLGVVKAFCKRCRSELIKSTKSYNKMECPSCGHIESRKISKDYGNVSEI